MSRPEDPKYRQVLPFGRPLPIVIDCIPNIMPAVPTSRFHTTSWTLVRAAADKPTVDSREALAALCQRYWHPVYAFVRRHGYDREQSQDLTQGFFAVLIEKNYLLDTDRERGKFRSFLLAAVKHFLANEWDRVNALKRGGGQVPVSIDLVEAEDWQASAVVEHATPESLFERRWALSLLENVMVKLRSEFADEGKTEEFARLSAFLNRDSESARYETVAEEMGVSAGALRMAVHRMRRRYRRLLRAEIAETLPGPEAEEIDDELRYILSVLSV
jgi:DNA-directed RNA polymerase specialized sigma24 family protein